MGRKSRADERRELILAAFERCIARYGVDVPLEQIAEEAGVQRSLIRHYLGNRDELVEQVIARIAEAYPRRLAELLVPAAAQGAAGVVECFFPAEVTDSDWDNVILAVVNTTQGRYPQAKLRLAAMIEAIVEEMAQAFTQLAPQTSPAARYATAYGILCLAQTNEAMLWLGLNPQHNALARASATRLLDALISQ